MLVTMCVLLMLAIPVAVAVGLAAIAGMTLFTPLPLVLVAQQAFAALDKFPLAAVPFFILAGNLMGEGGISARLVDFAKSIVGGVQGGLACTCILTCMIFAAVSGSSVATTFAIGAILIPAMVRARLSGAFRRGAAGERGRTRCHHPALHPADPLRRRCRGLDRRIVHRRIRAGPSHRRGADGLRLCVVPPQGLRRARCRRAAVALDGDATRAGWR